MALVAHYIKMLGSLQKKMNLTNTAQPSQPLGHLDLEVGQVEVGKDQLLLATHELEDVIVAVGPALDGMDGLVEHIHAGYEPHAIEATMLHWLVLGLAFLLNGAW